MNIGMVMMMCKTVFDLFLELLEQISKGGHGCVAHDRLSLSDCEKMRRNPDTDQNTERIAGEDRNEDARLFHVSHLLGRTGGTLLS